MSETPTIRMHAGDCAELPPVGEPFDVIYVDPPAESLRNGELAERLGGLVHRLSPQGFLLVHTGGSGHHEAKRMCDTLGLAFKGDLVWAYRQRSIKSSALQNQHQTILVYSDNSFYFPKRVLIAESVLGPSSSERADFPGQKPVKLYRQILGRLREYGRLRSALDPMAGSGSFLVAALELGMDVSGFETSAQAYELTKRRLEEARPATQQLRWALEELE